MNGAANHRRVLWLAAIGGVLLLSVLFVTLLAPSPQPAATSPVIRPAETATGESQDAAEPGSSGFSLGGGDIVSLGLRLIGTDPQWTYLLIGVLIISAVAIDQWIRKVAG